MYALAGWSVFPFLLLVLESLISDLGQKLVTEMSRILYVIWLLGVPLSTVLLVLFDASKIGKWSIGYMDRRIERDLVRHLQSGTLKRDVTNHLIEIVWKRARFDCNRESAAVLERLRTRKDELGRIVDDTVGLLDDSLAQGRASEKPEKRALRPLLAVQALLLALVMLVSWGIATGW